MAEKMTNEMLREFFESGSSNPMEFFGSRMTHDQMIDALAAGVVAANPEMTQVVTAAALLYCNKHFDDFRKEIGMDKSEGKTVRLYMTAAGMLINNGAKVMRREREADK